MTTHIQPKKERKKGYSLAEVIVGLSLFAMVIVSVYNLLGQGFMIMEAARDVTRISQTMQYQMENLRSTKWTDFIDQEVGTKEINVNYYGIPMDGGSNYIPYEWKAFKMTQTIAQEASGHYKATLVTDWIDRRGTRRTHTYTAWFTENGLNAYYTRST